jgi:hypothetical protein
MPSSPGLGEGVHMRMVISMLLVAPALVLADEPASPVTTDAAGSALTTGFVPYVGLSAGGGPSWVTIAGATDNNAGILFETRVGAVITSHLALDLNATAFAIQENNAFPRVDPALVMRLFNVYVAATVPIEDLLLRGGIGGGWLSGTNGWDAPSSPWSASGLVLVGGLGYRVWASQTSAFTFNVEGVFQRYGASSWRSDAVVCSLGFDVYFEKMRPAR